MGAHNFLLAPITSIKLLQYSVATSKYSKKSQIVLFPGSISVECLNLFRSGGIFDQQSLSTVSNFNLVCYNTTYLKGPPHQPFALRSHSTHAAHSAHSFHSAHSCHSLGTSEVYSPSPNINRSRLAGQV
jgi:hypothetical protein